ncbi:MAG TPA: hypothetical protein VMW27_18840 [Thermoanaerobaculia bacterium]|nr:hypothetical protein [Thermoanaerobaculia bacterium]
MRNMALFLAAVLVLVCAGRARADDYPYDRSVSGCVRGTCDNGWGVYVFADDDIYEGQWQGGKPHGEGVFFIVDGEPWSDAHKMMGTWLNGEEHGKFSYIFPSGSRKLQYWYHGEEVTSRIEKCRTADTITDGYKLFVAIVNGLVAAADGGNVGERAAQGYDAASRQVVPRAVDLTCDQLLAHFD